MAVLITCITIYRDGGSIEFRVARDGAVKHVRLETPFKGEPRSLRVDSVKLQPHSRELAELLQDIDNWCAALPEAQRVLAEEVLRKQGPHVNPGEEMSRAIDLSRVLFVQRYLRGGFLQPRHTGSP